VKVTLHLVEGQTMKDLISEVAEISRQPVRSVSGRNGVLVDGETAYWYLSRRFAPRSPLPEPTTPPPPPGVPVADIVPPAAPEPAKKAAPRKRAQPKATEKMEV
jgi:hypothetical protein